MAIYPKLIMDALEKVRYPGTGKNIVEAGMVEDNIRIDGNKVSFSLIFPKETDPFICISGNHRSFWQNHNITSFDRS